MGVATRFAAAVAAGFGLLCADGWSADIESLAAAEPAPAMAKSASAQSLAARATASSAATVYGAFELTSATTVYILVRGPSLRTLGVTQNALDAPWVRVFDSAGRDRVTTTLTGGGSVNGAGRCDTSSSLDKPVIDYYQLVRNAPANERDSCIAATFTAGSYTFSVTPSIAGVTSPAGYSSSPASGEILFEVTLGPAAPVEDNRARTERLVGGTWTFNYLIGTLPFNQTYSFTSVQANTAAPGDYLAVGRDQFGDLVVGTYNSATGFWGVLDESTLFDRFFTFTFPDLNHVSGCYYQISPPGSTNLGTCYSMTGVRSPFKAFTADSDPARQELDEYNAAAAHPGGVDQAPSAGAEVLRGAREALRGMQEER